MWCLQEFFDRLFPTREVFAALAPFILQLAPEDEREVQAFMGKRFRLYNIGIQIRRRKCNGDRQDLSCELRPSIEAYCQVGFAFRIHPCSPYVAFDCASFRQVSFSYTHRLQPQVTSCCQVPFLAFAAWSSPCSLAACLSIRPDSASRHQGPACTWTSKGPWAL